MAGTCRRGGCTAGTAGVESSLPRGPGTRGSHAMKQFGLTELGDSFQRLAGVLLAFSGKPVIALKCANHREGSVDITFGINQWSRITLLVGPVLAIEPADSLFRKTHHHQLFKEVRLPLLECCRV